ncbi:OX-2 membrane glycoprotein-like isoform X2 [Hyperolius riggenbachi]|uniref:OX-2 membrane glycoprotein-like isoform X2 n=1 Tax=Hyperolius riggenbachi TaxID=752182 RepID=UPI0035A2C793
MTLISLLLLWLSSYSAHGSLVVKSVAKQEARVGSNVTLLCQLEANQSNIFQITWEKESGNFTGTVATSSRTYGEKLLGYSAGRTAQHTADTLNASAITINPVTLEDQGCFKCTFNVYPFGANSGTTCLDVYETSISEPALDLHTVDSPDQAGKHLVVTCSANGKPAPEITWNLTAGLQIVPRTYSIEHPNGTVTVISNFTNRVTQESNKVTCVVSHPALHHEKHLSKTLEDTGPETDDLKLLIYIIPAIILLGCLCTIVGTSKHCKSTEKAQLFCVFQPQNWLSSTSIQQKTLLTV